MASRYFADVVKQAEKETNYQKELAMYKKAYNVLFNINPSARYETYTFLKGEQIYSFYGAKDFEKFA